MNVDWPEVRLEDITSILGDGLHGTPKYEEDGEYFFINGNNLSNGKIVFNENTKRASREEYLKYKKELNERTVLVSINGTLGNVAFYNGEKVFLGKSACYFNVVDDIDKKFVRYVISSKLFQDYIITYATGTTIKNVSLKSMRDFIFRLPPINEQKRISKVLGDLDDKIELNHQINQTLESMAKTIFKSWFVDFEPVKAKIAALGAGEDAEGVTCAAIRAISGKTDDELDQLQAGQPENYAQLKTTAELFPTAIQDSELGEVPEGWEVSTIGDEVGVVGGGTPSTKIPEFWDGGEIHWTTPKDLSNLSDKVLLTTERKITTAGLKKISSGLLPINTVLMSSRAPVGYLALAKVPVAVNQGYIAMLCDKRLSPEFVIQWCNSVMDEIKQRSSGTTFAEISKKNFKVIPLVVPSEGIQQSYFELVSGIYNKIAETATECKTLADIRDSLLPKLLSGEVTP